MSFSKKNVFHILGLSLALATTACSKQEPSASATQPATSKTIQVGMDIAFPPFEYMENNEATGLDVDIMNRILGYSSSSANYIDTRFYNLIPGLNGKKFDIVISGLYITPERMKQVDMIPYYKTTEAVVVLKDGTFKPKLREDLCGKTIATQKGTKYPDQLKSIAQESCIPHGKGDIKVLEFETSPQAIQAVLSKAADGEYDDIAALKLASEKLKDRIEITTTDPFFPMFGGIVVRKGDEQTYKMISEGLEKLKQSGEYEKLLQQHGLMVPTAEEIENLMKNNT